MAKKFTIAKSTYILKKYNSMFDDLLEQYHMTQIEVDTLLFLANNPEYNHAKDIVEIRGISKAHVSIAIDKLVQKGLLERLCDPDNRRCNILKLTFSSKDIVKTLQERQKLFFQYAYKDFSQDEEDMYDQLVERIYENLREMKSHE